MYLTKREKPVVDFLMAGFCRKDIATKLGIDNRTVSGAIQRASARYGATNSEQLVMRVALQRLCTYTNEQALKAVFDWPHSNGVPETP